MDGPLSIWEIVGRLALAVAGGAAVGWERQSKDKPAGLRTHMMVALGAAMFVVTGLELSGGKFNAGEYRVDMSRIIEGIIGGVGFLGAGSIIQSRGSVQGITTAASIWVVAAIGTAGGLGHYVLAGLCVAFGLAILHGLEVLERNTFGNSAAANTKETKDENRSRSE
jgi:putative Mg2+ transporter-C (MgtC) family protein